jgi:hypothetical protein
LNLYALRRPLIYFDLDMIICGDLQRLLDWEGFGTLENSWADIMGHPVGYNTSVLKLTGDEGFVWDKFHPGILALRGDQDWLNVIYPGQPTFPRAWFPSYKIDKLYKNDAPPHGAMACNFHGQPKPHEFTEAHGWVKDYWTGNIPAHAA